MIRLLASILLLALIGLSSPASAQSRTLVDLRDFSPRELAMASFTLASPQTVRVEALGAKDRGRDRWDGWDWDKRWERPDYWPGEAWILDARTREVVWTLREADTDERRGVHTFEGTVQLPAGTYEAYYASYPGMSYYWSDDDDDDHRGLIGTISHTISSFFDGDRGTWQRQGYGGEFVENEAFRDFRLVVRGDGRTGDRDALQEAYDAFTANAFVTLVGLEDETYEQQGFVLNRPTEIDLYAIGEARRDEAYDYGWILNADTRETVWTFDGYSSEWAGGSDKNRVVRETLSLPAGRYAAFVVTDDSHASNEWNAVPAFDPVFWGLTLRTSDRANVELFDYEHVPPAETFLSLTRARDDDFEARGFTLDRRTNVRVYALGEATDHATDFHDYGWIVDADTRERVWDMRDGRTEHAGGAQKNRVFDGIVTLDAGDYIAYYVTDDSHAYRDWNASPPVGGEYWGLSLLTAEGADRIQTFAERDRTEANVIAQITRVRDSDRGRQRFTLDRPTEVRIYALGEGSGDHMYDYGWIEDAETGRAVWEMTYRTTERAGGAKKNRMANVTLTLPAGDYELRYRTDGSHAFGDWNASPPDDPLYWGITVYRADTR